MKKRRLKKVPVVLLLFIMVGIAVILSLFNTDNKQKTNIQKEEQNNVSEVKKDINEEKVVEEVKETKKTMSIIMVGDALIHDSIYNDAFIGNNQYDFKKMFVDIEPLIKDYDLKYYNQETIIGGKDLGLSNYPLFNSPDEIGSDLVSIGFNMVSLANNHSLDKGERGLNYSINFWNNQEGVVIAGSYASWEDRDNIKIHEMNGIKYAFLSYTVSTNGLRLPEGKEYLVNVYSDELAKKDIESVRDKVDVVIVAMHWGNEYTHTPTYEQKRMAKYLSDLGVNLIIGCHPHVIQPIDYVGDTLVIYSLGNFISSQKSLGLAKIIGLMVGVDIVVDQEKVTFENLQSELLFTYDNRYKDFKIIPFSNLNDEILNNYEQIREEYMNIVNAEVYYD